jgi:hypothetical protein
METPTQHSWAYLREGWRVVRAAWGPTLLVVLVWAVLTNIAATLCFVPLLVVGGPLTGGLYLFCAKRLLGLGGEVGDLLLGFRRFGPTTVVYVTATVVFFVVLIVLAAPIEIVDVLGLVDTDNFEAMPVVAQIVLGGWALVVLVLAAVASGVVLTFGMPFALFDPAPGAWNRALSASRAHLGRVLALNLWGSLFVVAATAAGLLLCLVGVFVLQPLALGALTVAHLALVRDTTGLDPSKLAAFQPTAAPLPA